MIFLNINQITNTTIYYSDSQPGCRKEVSGTPPNFELLAFLMFYYIGYRKIVIFNQLGVPPNFLKDLRGAANQKRLKNTDIIAITYKF